VQAEEIAAPPEPIVAGSAIFLKGPFYNPFNPDNWQATFQTTYIWQKKPSLLRLSATLPQHPSCDGHPNGRPVTPVTRKKPWRLQNVEERQRNSNRTFQFLVLQFPP
jgi:hypothetical protein